MSPSYNRRKFLSSAGALTLGAGLFPINAALAKSRKSAVGAADKIRIGLIGARGMGFYILENAMKQPEVECVALCDIDDSVLAARSQRVLEFQETKPKTYKDFRKLLDNKDVDAVIIGTPDHWHCLIMIEACKAGKDVYVEKPMANSLAELDEMVAAAHKYERVVQVGQQQRSAPQWMDVMEFIKSGKIGQLRQVNVWANFEYGRGPEKLPDSPVPEGVDYDMWLGPAPERSFNPNRFHGTWRMFWDYGGGLVTDWGVHLIDMALWAKDVDYAPIAVSASGGNYAFQNYAHETFDTMSVTWQMKDYVMNWTNIAGVNNGPYGKNYGLEFVGNDATIFANRQGWEVHPVVENGAYKVPPIPPRGGKEHHEEHVKNFLACIRSRETPNCPVENGRLVAQYAHMGNIALRSKSRLEWDAASGSFGKDHPANAFIKPEYRKPWKFPKIV